MADDATKANHVQVTLPDDLVEEIRSKLDLPNAKAIPRTLTVTALPRNLQDQIGHNRHISVTVMV
jgi:hypothetical protein